MTTEKPESTDGLITIPSRFSVRETIDRLASAAASKGLSVFARVDHSGNAEAAGLELRPTELIVFGNARGGTPLMQEKQTAGIDLPLKALGWEDAQGKVWLTYNDVRWLAGRHGLGAGSQAAVAAMVAGIAALCGAAAGG
jgi:uncharacterized protein (DUF302 family)